MPDPFSQAATAFSEQVSAAALFFSGNNKALRLEAPDIALEFTDKAYIGTGQSSHPHPLLLQTFDTPLLPQIPRASCTSTASTTLP